MTHFIIQKLAYDFSATSLVDLADSQPVGLHHSKVGSADWLDWAGAMVFDVVLSVLAGYVYYYLVERRFLSFFRNRFAGRSNDCVPRPLASR